MENNLIKYIVYCTTCTINKKIYIGVHRTNPEYFDGYIGNGVYNTQPHTYEHSKTKFQAAVKKYGPKNFYRITLATFDNEEDAYSLEADIVNEEFLKRTDVYNMALGGRIGTTILQAIPTYQYDSEGNFVNEYASMMYAAQNVNRNLRSIQRAINNKYKCADYFWTTVKYDKLDLSKMHQYEGQTKIPVFQYDSLGNYECCYESIKCASKLLGVSDTNLSRAIHLNRMCNNKYFSEVFCENYSIVKNKRINQSTVYQYDLNGNYIQSFSNQQQARKALGIKGSIYDAIKLGKTCGGFQWSFEKLESIAPCKPKSGSPRKVGKYDKDWNLIKVYDSIAKCIKENGSGMQHVIRGRDEFSKGYRYKFIE